MVDFCMPSLVNESGYLIDFVATYKDLICQSFGSYFKNKFVKDI